MTLNEQNFEAIKQALNKTYFPGCDNVLVGDVLHYAFKHTNIEHTFKRVLRYFWRILMILKVLLFSCYAYKHVDGECKENKEKAEGKGKGKGAENALFLFSSSYGSRREQRAIFLRSVELFPKSSYACYDGKKRFSIRNFRYIWLLFRWNTLIKKECVSNDSLIKITILLSLFTVYCDYKAAEREFAGFKDIRTLVSWCDCHPVDSFFTQKFNAMNKNTVELMHGSIGIRGSNPWSVLGIKSKNFIADSKSTADILRSVNYKGKIFICGYVYHIDTDFQRFKAIDTIKSLAVFLSGEEVEKRNFHNANIDLCNDISQLHTTRELTVYCKPHPTSSRNMYPTSCWTPYEQVYGTEIQAAELLSKVDVAIICPSTVIYEALQHGVPFLVHADKDDVYKLYNMPEEITVHDYNELVTKLEKIEQGEYTTIYETLADYYSACGNVKENYIKAFHELGIY